MWRLGGSQQLLLQNSYWGDTMEPSLLGSRFYCVTAAMETKWDRDNDKIAGKVRTCIVDI